MAATDYAKAAKTLLAALDLDPDNKEIADEELEAEKKAKAADLEKQADQLMDEGKFAEAGKLYAVAMGLDPTNVRLPAKQKDAVNKAQAQELKEQAEHECDALDFAQAVDTFDKALALDPDDGSPRHAQIQKERDDAARMVHMLELKKKGEGEMAEGKYDDAVRTLLEALELDPSNKELSHLPPNPPPLTTQQPPKVEQLPSS